MVVFQPFPLFAFSPVETPHQIPNSGHWHGLVNMLGQHQHLRACCDIVDRSYHHYQNSYAPCTTLDTITVMRMLYDSFPTFPPKCTRAHIHMQHTHTNKHAHTPTHGRDALDALGLKRYCCRRMLLSHVDLIEKLLNYAPLEK